MNIMDKYTIFEIIVFAHMLFFVAFVYVCSAFYTTLAHNLSEKGLMRVERLTTFLWFMIALSAVAIAAILFYYEYHIIFGIGYGLASALLYFVAFSDMVCSGPTNYIGWNDLNDEDNENED